MPNRKRSSDKQDQRLGAFGNLVPRFVRGFLGKLADAWRTVMPERQGSERVKGRQRFAQRAKEGDEASWDALVETYEDEPEFLDRLALLAQGLEKVGRSVSAEFLERLATRLESAAADAPYIYALKAFPALIRDDAYLEALAPLVPDNEAAAAIHELADVLASRGRKDVVASELLDLIRVLSSRASIKRFKALLEILSENDIEVDEFDGLLLSLMEDFDWIKIATKELRATGIEKIDRLLLVRLRDWAPDTSSLVRYFRIKRAFEGSGLDGDALDAAILPHLSDENSVAALCLLGGLGEGFFAGGITADRLGELLKALGTPAAVRRFKQAAEMLRDVGLNDADALLLAPDFTASSEALLWLETFVIRAKEDHVAMSRVELVRVHERCPEIAQLYRFLRICRYFTRFKPACRSTLEQMGLEAAESNHAAEAVVGLIEGLIGQGVSGTVSPEELLEFYGPLRLALHASR